MNKVHTLRKAVKRLKKEPNYCNLGKIAKEYGLSSLELLKADRREN